MLGKRWLLAVAALAAAIGCAYPEVSFVAAPDDGSITDVTADSTIDSSVSDASIDTAAMDRDTQPMMGDTGAPADTTPLLDAPSCASPKVLCGASCYDISSDASHCGDCATKCPPSSTCSAGKCNCISGASLCTIGGSRCVDLGADPFNCKSCGVHCGDDSYCNGAGACWCRVGLTYCSTAPIGCFDLNRDPRHCGACGTVCTGDNPCINGVCSAMICPTGMTKCSYGLLAGCVHLAIDNLNCGSCGTKCPVDAVCSKGSCVDYRPAIGCTSCPCAVCDSIFSGGTTCCPGMPGFKYALCMQGTGQTCPCSSSPCTT